MGKALEVAILLIAPAVGIAVWFVLSGVRMRSRSQAVIVAVATLVEIYVLVAAVLVETPDSGFRSDLGGLRGRPEFLCPAAATKDHIALVP